MDVLLLGFIAGYIAGGWRSGFLRRLAGLGFIVLAFVLGAYVRQPLGALIGSIFKVPDSYGELIAYIFIFPVVYIVAHALTNNVLKHTAVSGVSQQLDKVLGAIFGGVEAILIISVVIVILDTYFGTGSTLPPTYEGLGFLQSIDKALDASTTAQILIK